VASVTVEGAELEQARAFLARLEASTGVPPVDEDEQRRLAASPPIRDRDWSWGGHLALIDGTPVAYAGTRLPPRPPTDPADCAARVDLALDRTHPTASEALIAALTDARDHADRRAGRDAGAGATTGRVQAWLRGATELDVAASRLAGFRVLKRLHVMAVPLGPGAERTAPLEHPPALEGLRIRPYDPDDPTDGDAVVALLSVVYPGSEGGWDAPGFAVRRATEWFRAEDLLLLEERDGGATGGLLGVHWTKRRGGGVGEVHNLALAPAARGRGLGGALLDAGLAHLAAVGCHEVILWVDAENTPALDLYRSRGFVPRWDDVALVG